MQVPFWLRLEIQFSHNYAHAFNTASMSVCEITSWLHSYSAGRLWISQDLYMSCVFLLMECLGKSANF